MLGRKTKLPLACFAAAYTYGNHPTITQKTVLLLSSSHSNLARPLYHDYIRAVSAPGMHKPPNHPSHHNTTAPGRHDGVSLSLFLHNYAILVLSFFLKLYFSLKVAGHCSILKLDGMVCKPLNPRECEFYETIYKEFPQLIPLTPEFHGSITIRNQKATNQEAQIVSDKLTIHHNPSLMRNYLNLSINQTIPSHFLPATNPSNNSTEYIVLQDLTAGMSKPCAMDMKVFLLPPHPPLSPSLLSQLFPPSPFLLPANSAMRL